MAVISEYTETPLRAVLTSICIYPLESVEETHGIKDKHKQRYFQEINSFHCAIHAHSVVLSFHERWVLYEEQHETQLRG